MKVRGIDHFSPALIHPDFFLNGLAVGTVTVTVGIIVDLGMSTILTDTDVVSQGTRFAM